MVTSSRYSSEIVLVRTHCKGGGKLYSQSRRNSLGRGRKEGGRRSIEEGRGAEPRKRSRKKEKKVIERRAERKEEGKEEERRRSRERRKEQREDRGAEEGGVPPTPAETRR